MVSKHKVCKLTRDRPIHVFEWVAAFALTGLGFHLLIFPHSLLTSRFYLLLATVHETTLMLFCIGTGLGRLYALATMGRWLPWCARVRAVCSGISFVIWVQMALALILYPDHIFEHFDSYNPSPGVPIYVSLALGELFTIWRARRELNGTGH